MSQQMAQPPIAINLPARTGSPTALPVSFNAVYRNLGTGTGRRTVLQDVNLDVQAGEIVAIVGPSGCGKTTLLRATCGLDTAGGGTVAIGGIPVSANDNRCAVSFGQPQLLSEHTLQANVAMGLPIGTSAKTGKAKVSELLKLLGLEQVAKQWPREVSAGLAHRAALARALARNPGVLLLDEPFSTLDAFTRAKMQELLLEIHRAARTTVLLVTDVVDEAVQLADRIVVLGASKNGDGSANPESGSSVVEELELPAERPRKKGSSTLDRIRSSLQGALGIVGK